MILDPRAFSARFRNIPGGWIDNQDGQPVVWLSHPRIRGEAEMVLWEEFDTAAHIASEIQSPWLCRIRCIRPQIMADVPPAPPRPDWPLPVDEAVDCLLQLCCVLAEAHARGWAGLGTGPEVVQVWRPQATEPYRVHLVLPHLRSWEAREAHALEERFGAVRADLYSAVALYRDLLLGPQPAPGWLDPHRRQPRAPPALTLPDCGLTPVQQMLEGLLSTGEVPGLSASAVALARLTQPLARVPEAWAERLATLPEVEHVRRRRNWDLLIQLGQTDLDPSDPEEEVTLALAEAHHQRAVLALGAGRLVEARRDLERALALDPFARYRVTLGLLREAEGDRAGALEDYRQAVGQLRQELDSSRGIENEDPEKELARALYVKGVARLRLGQARAAKDLEEALALCQALARRGGHGLRVAGTPLPELESRVKQALRVASRPKQRSRGSR